MRAGTGRTVQIVPETAGDIHVCIETLYTADAFSDDSRTAAAGVAARLACQESISSSIVLQMDRLITLLRDLRIMRDDDTGAAGGLQ